MMIYPMFMYFGMNISRIVRVCVVYTTVYT